MTCSTRILTVCVLTLALAAAGIAAAVAADDPAASGTMTVTKAAKARGSAVDENIKAPFKANSTANKPDAPAQKGGEKERGTCAILVDNWTPWHIEIYVDGDYVGMVSPYGQATGYFHSGRRKAYARATFDDGSVLTWGPSTLDCHGVSTWRLE